MELSKLENSDTIVLLGIIYASEFGTKKINIAQIVSSFDFIEHAIISYEELKGALCRLSANNYVKESKHLEFLPSESVIEHLQFLKNKKKLDLRLELNFIKEMINARDWDKNFDYITANSLFEYNGLTQTFID